MVDAGLVVSYGGRQHKEDYHQCPPHDAECGGAALPERGFNAAVDGAATAAFNE